MAIKTITFEAGNSIFLPKNAVIRNVIFTEEASVDSECLTIGEPEELECFKVAICQANQIREGSLDAPADGHNLVIIDDAANTDNWESVTYRGLIINGESILFPAPVTIDLGNGVTANDTDEVEQLMEEGVDAILLQISATTTAQRGLIKDVCRGDVTDDNYDMGVLSSRDRLGGVCCEISFRAPVSIMTDARLYGEMNSFEGGEIPFQYPLIALGQSTCDCAS